MTQQIRRERSTRKVKEKMHEEEEGEEEEETEGRKMFKLLCKQELSLLSLVLDR